MPGNGDGTFQTALNLATGQGPLFVTAADLNGDFKVDLAVACSAPREIAILLDNGDGTFQTPANYAAGANVSSVAVGDLNQDGKMDLVATANHTNNAAVLIGKETEPFKHQLTIQRELPQFPSPSWI